VTDVAIVTGGAGGIGQAINRRLTAAGYTVVAGDLADMLAKDDPSGENIHPVEMDVRDQASVDAAVAKAVERGTLRGVVNCAGLVRFTPVADSNEDEMDILWRVNVAGAARVLKAAKPHLGPGSAVVNIASITGLMGTLTGASMYGASKAGLIQYTRYLAAELSGGEERLMEAVPLKRLGTVDEMADVVEYLLSDRASYITGATIVADGGITAL
jgi:3-oxoacyl-[acyl-carrier protein] reductase